MKFAIAVLLAGMLILPADSFARKERDAGLSRGTSTDVRKMHDRVRQLALTDETPYANLPALSTQYDWGGAWELSGRSVAKRDAQDRVIEVLYEQWDVIQLAFVASFKVELTYSTNPGPDAIISSQFISGNWKASTRTLLTYNGQGYVVEELTQVFQVPVTLSAGGGEWVNQSRNTYTRGAAGERLTETGEVWIPGPNFWIEIFRILNTFNGSMLMESVREFKIGDTWTLEERTLLFYAGIQVIEELVQRWIMLPTASAVWQDAFRYRSAYANELLASYTEESFTGTEWVNLSRTLYTNDVPNQRPIELIYQEWLSGQWTNITRFVLEYDTPTGIGGDGRSILPDGVALNQNSPNPFNPTTTISFTLPRRATISLAVFDLLGRKVTDLFKGELPAGEHPFTWDGRTSEGSPVATGMYFYRLQTVSGSLTRRMVLVK